MMPNSTTRTIKCRGLLHGPISAVSKDQLAAGLSIIIKLANFAPERGTDGRKRFSGAEPQPLYSIIMDGSEKVFSGDANVYQWNCESRANHTAVGSALMALEKWLYDSIDAKPFNV